MEPEQDTEITLGTAKLLGLFFGLVIVCAVFFALGYTLGRKTDAGVIASSTATPQTSSNGLKPAGSASPQPAPPMTFYKAVEQKDANPQLTPASDANSATPAAGQPASSPASSSSGTSSPATQTQPSPTANPPDPMAVLPAVDYFVQVAAVTKQEDADSLVDALKKKQYPAFVAANSTADKFFRVQVGPFTDIKDAEAMRTRLINDGYNPIVKK
jgi:DedD protein